MVNGDPDGLIGTYDREFVWQHITALSVDRNPSDRHITGPSRSKAKQTRLHSNNSEARTDGRPQPRISHSPLPFSADRGMVNSFHICNGGWTFECICEKALRENSKWMIRRKKTNMQIGWSYANKSVRSIILWSWYMHNSIRPHSHMVCSKGIQPTGLRFFFMTSLRYTGYNRTWNSKFWGTKYSLAR